MKRLLSLLLILCMLLPGFALGAGAQGLPLQECHKVKLTRKDTKQDNKSVIRLWSAATALPSVDEEINAIAAAYADRIGPTLPNAVNTGDKGSRVDVEIRYSRTGLTWLSFMVQARTSYHRALTAQEFTTRTYDMITGDRITMKDLFGDNEEAWTLLQEAVRTAAESYFPAETAISEAVERYASREGVENIDFTLHGLSLVLHMPADAFYPEHHTLIEVTLFYPDIRPYMTEKAQLETDNMNYYYTAALTFDDGPSRTNTTGVLNALMETGSRATFFVIGNRIKGYQDQVQKEHDNGHAVGTHNWTHANVPSTSAGTLRAMPAKCDAAMIAAIGIPVRFDRVPGGLYPKMVSSKVGWPLIQWSLDTYDWRGRTSSAVLSSVKKKLADGDIILCHDIKDNTPESARKIAEYVASKGYILLTIDELFAKDGVVLQPDTVYYRCVDGVTTKKPGGT